MLVTLSDRIFCNTIRTLEGLDPSVPSAEILQVPAYYDRFLAYLRDGFGLEVEQGTAQVSNGFGLFRVIIHTTDLEQLAQGLDLIKPLNVSLEQADLPNLGAPLAVPQWSAIAPRLQRLSLPLVNVMNALNDAMGALQPGEVQLDTPTFAEWAVQNNIELPRVSASELRAQRFAREAEARKKANDDRIAQRENSSSLRIRDLPTF